MNCIVGLIVVIIVVFVIMLIGGCCAYKNEIESFTQTILNNSKSLNNSSNSLGGIYKEVDQELAKMKTENGIGEPNGILMINPDSPECKTEQNVMVQSNVAFRPHRVGKNGCTYIDKQWPVA